MLGTRSTNVKARPLPNKTRKNAQYVTLSVQIPIETCRDLQRKWTIEGESPDEGQRPALDEDVWK